MPKILATIGAALALMLTLTTAHATSCSSPSRVLLMLAAVETNISDANQRQIIAGLRQEALTQADWIAESNPATMSATERAAFYGQVEANTAERLQKMQAMVRLLEPTAPEAAAIVRHFAVAVAGCTTPKRMALLQDLAVGKLPANGGPLRADTLQEAKFACGLMLSNKGIFPPEQGFWQACAAQAIDHALRTDPEHFTTHHPVAEALCALSTPLPPATMLAQR